MKTTKVLKIRQEIKRHNNMICMEKWGKRISEIRNSESVRRSVENLGSVFSKYYVLFTFLFCIVINPIVIEKIFINDGIGNARGNLYVFEVFGIVLALSISVFFISLAIKGMLNNNLTRLYLAVFIVFMCRNGYNVKLVESMASLVALSILCYVLYAKRDKLWLVPLICFACDIFRHQFAIDYLICILVLCRFPVSREKKWYEIDINIDMNAITKNEKVTVLLSIVVQLACTVWDWVRGLPQLDITSMTWQFYNDYFMFGFGARGLMATLRRMIFGQESSMYLTKAFVLICHCIVYFAVLLLLAFVWKMISRRNINSITAKLLFVAYICSETFRKFGEIDLIIYFDNVLLLFALSCIVLIICDKYIWGTCPLLVVAMCVHHGFAIFLFPVIFSVMLYKMFLLIKYKSKEWKKMCIVITVASLLVIVMFGYFQFFAYKTNHVSFENACQYIAKECNRIIPKDYSIDSLMENTADNQIYVNVNYLMYNGMNTQKDVQNGPKDSGSNTIIFLICMIPLALLYLSYFKYLFGNIQINHLKTERKILLDKLLMFIPIGTLLINLVSYKEVDYGRWNGNLIFILLWGMISFELVSIIVMNDVKEKDGLETALVNTEFDQMKEQAAKVIIIFMMLIPTMGAFGIR